MQDMITKTAAIAAINATKITRGYKEIAADVINEIEESDVMQVSECYGCPLTGRIELNDTVFVFCKHPNSDGSEHRKYSAVFEKCPLKTNSLTIQLNTAQEADK